MSNPPVSFRLPLKDRGRLDQLSTKTGKSLGQLIRENLGVAERDEEATYHRAWNKGYSDGHSDGVSETENKLAICYRCTFCNEPILVSPNGPEHHVILDELRRLGWGHSRCFEESRR